MDNAYNEQYDDRLRLGKARDAIVSCCGAVCAARFEQRVSLDSNNWLGHGGISPHRYVTTLGFRLVRLIDAAELS
jgi:hypothetical protein